MSPAENRLLPAPHAGLISVSGADAAAFLDAQLSRRVAALSPQRSLVAGWHDARGRVRAVFRVLVTAEGYLLIGPAELTETLLDTLRMFVLRARVTLERAPLRCAAVIGAPGAEPLSAPGGIAGTWNTAAALPSAPDAVATAGPVTAVCIAPGCWYLLGPADEPSFAPAGEPMTILAAEIRNGLPQVDANTAARYVPHMLNLDALGALDFEKGCYPGQEIIARTQHLGTVKRRACGFTCTGTPPPDSDTPVFDDRGERVGEVLRAAAEDSGDVVLLAVVALDALERRLFVGSADGPPLARFALPYERPAGPSGLRT